MIHYDAISHRWIDDNDEEYLEHHGIKGQKWGRRRYQHEDGSYTPEGAKRYAAMYGYDKDKSYQRSEAMRSMNEEARKAHEKKASESKGLAKVGNSIMAKVYESNEKYYEKSANKRANKLTAEKIAQDNKEASRKKHSDMYENDKSYQRSEAMRSMNEDARKTFEKRAEDSKGLAKVGNSMMAKVYGSNEKYYENSASKRADKVISKKMHKLEDDWKKGKSIRAEFENRGKSAVDRVINNIK